MSKLKSNKALLKRIRVTKNKKAITKISGQNHFNAKESGNTTRGKRGEQSLELSSVPRNVRKHLINKK